MRSRIGVVYGLPLAALLMLVPATSALAQGAPSAGRRARWQAMAAACTGKVEKAACSFSYEGKTINGTCHRSRKGKLFCHSEGMHHGTHNHHMGNMTPPANPPQ